MEVKTCRRCNKMFQYITGKPVCPKCKKEEEVIFQQVKEYLRENVGASAEEVSEATEATISMIQGFLREGRLEVTVDSPLAMTCEQCGTKIRTGRMCDKCKANLANGLSGVAKGMVKVPEVKQEPKERMRSLGHR